MGQGTRVGTRAMHRVRAAHKLGPTVPCPASTLPACGTDTVVVTDGAGTDAVHRWPGRATLLIPPHLMTPQEQ